MKWPPKISTRSGIQSSACKLRHHVVRFEVRFPHHLGEAIVAPGPAHRPALLVEVPALAAGHPDALLGGLDTILVELFEGRLARADLVAFAGAQPFHELEDVAELKLGDLDQREVSDRRVRPG